MADSSPSREPPVTKVHLEDLTVNTGYAQVDAAKNNGGNGQEDEVAARQDSPQAPTGSSQKERRSSRHADLAAKKSAEKLRKEQEQAAVKEQAERKKAETRANKEREDAKAKTRKEQRGAETRATKQQKEAQETAKKAKAPPKEKQSPPRKGSAPKSQPKAAVRSKKKPAANIEDDSNEEDMEEQISILRMTELVTNVTGSALGMADAYATFVMQQARGRNAAMREQADAVDAKVTELFSRTRKRPAESAGGGPKKKAQKIAVELDDEYDSDPDA